MLLGKSLNQEYRKKMDGVSDFVAEYAKRLARPIKDLDDVRNAMGALEDLRQNEIRIDMILGPIEVRLSIFFSISSLSIPVTESTS